MPEDQLERKTYRRSPGRQYGYEYDPLQSQSGKSRSGSTANRSDVLLSQRPDPRRTRQLLRQSIIANRKLEDETLEEDQPELLESPLATDRSRPTRHVHHPPSEDLPPSGRQASRKRLFARHDEDELPAPRYRARGGRATASPEPYLPSTRELMGEDKIVQEEWPHPERRRYVDPDLGIDEDDDLNDQELDAYDYAAPSQTRGGQLRPRRATTRHLPEELLEEEIPEEEFPDEGLDEDYIYDENEELPPGLRVVKKPSSSRRKFLIGAGAVVAGGAAVGLIASQSNPNAPLPHMLNNVNKQVDDAYNRGLSQGADQAKREMLVALDNLENFTLQGAIDAARLTRTAYDVFVSPIIKFGTEITGDFLTGMLNAFKIARNWLAGINQDNATLAAIQKVLESWVQEVKNLPKQLDAITDTDLDGAQAYLRALQRKIEIEKNALNNSTPTAQAKPSPTPKKS